MKALKIISIIAIAGGTGMALYGLYVTQLQANQNISIAKSNRAITVGFSGGGLLTVGAIMFLISRRA